MKVSFSGFSPANIKYTRLDRANTRNTKSDQRATSSCPSFGAANPIEDFFRKYPKVKELIKSHEPLEGKLLWEICSNFKILNETETYKTIERLLKFRILARANKRLLARANENYTNQDVDNLLFAVPFITYNVISTLGETNFLYSFKDKRDRVQEYMTTIGLRVTNNLVKERLKELINPLESRKYNDLETKIKLLKKQFPQVQKDPENKTILMNKINTLTKERNDLMENSVKDPKDCLELALITANLAEHTLKVFEILDNAKLNTPASKKEFYNYLEKYLHIFLGINDWSPNLKSKLDFSNNKYLPRLFKSKEDFRINLRELIKLLEENPDKSTSEIFNLLPQNIKTRYLFERQGLNYDRWCAHNPDSYLEYRSENEKYRIQKIDMNNIVKVIFSGDEVSCCTKRGGKFDASAVTYAKNKMFSGIEILCNDEVIGNTMCYIGLVEGKPSLILDDIELLPQYRVVTKQEVEGASYEEYQQHILLRNSIIKYAQELTKDIGVKDMPIFLNATRQKVNTDDLIKKMLNVVVIGDSGNDKVYIDSFTSDFRIDGNSRYFGTCELYAANQSAKKINRRGYFE